MTYFRHTRLLLGSAALIALAAPAYALDGTDLLNKFNAVYSVQYGTTITAKSINVDGTTVTMTGVGMKSEGTEETIGDLTLNNVAEDGKGGYTIGEALFPDVNVTEDGSTLTAKDLSMNDIAIPGDTTKNTLDSLLWVERMRVGPVTVSEGGKEMFSLSEIKADFTKRDGNTGLDWEIVFGGLKADVSKAEDASTKDALQALDIQQIEGEMSLTGGWELASGTVDITEYALDFTDIGRLSFSLSFSGYTMELMRSMQESMKALELNVADEQAQQAAGFAMMGMAQQLTFNRASLSFTDASITMRLMEYFGKEQGISGREFAQSVKGMVPLMVAELNMPELQKQITEAVSTYIDDPQNLTISAEPETPVPFPMIMGAVLGNPDSLPQVLGVTVSANDEE